MEAAAVVYAVFLWWFATGVLLVLARWRARRIAVLAAGLGVAALALAALAALRDVATPWGAVAGFSAAILVWASVELSFLTGLVTGPRRLPLAEGTVGGARWRAALATVAHHEAALVAAGLLVALAGGGGANMAGPLTFLALWLMRISAKLNLFLGAPHVSAAYLPRHLAYLGSYFGKNRPSWFFAATLAFATLLAAGALHMALHASDAHGSVAWSLLTALLVLAVVEHGFLVLPIPDTLLWRWALSPDASAPCGLTRETPRLTGRPS